MPSTPRLLPTWEVIFSSDLNRALHLDVSAPPPCSYDEPDLTSCHWLPAAPRPLLLSTELSSVSTLAGMPPPPPRTGLRFTPLPPNAGGSVGAVASGLDGNAEEKCGGWPTSSEALLGGNSRALSASMCFRPLAAALLFGCEATWLLGLRPASSSEVILSVSCRPD